MRAASGDPAWVAKRFFPGSGDALRSEVGPPNNES